MQGNGEGVMVTIVGYKTDMLPRSKRTGRVEQHKQDAWGEEEEEEEELKKSREDRTRTSTDTSNRIEMN
jgi:hypothetical protein